MCADPGCPLPLPTQTATCDIPDVASAAYNSLSSLRNSPLFEESLTKPRRVATRKPSGVRPMAPSPEAHCLFNASSRRRLRWTLDIREYCSPQCQTAGKASEKEARERRHKQPAQVDARVVLYWTAPPKAFMSPASRACLIGPLKPKLTLWATTCRQLTLASARPSPGVIGTLLPFCPVSSQLETNA
jgi:hypothetical protein